jgi:hypothetical protein
MDWLNFVIKKESHPKGTLNVLLFHCTADRDPQTLLSIIAKEYQFEKAIFCPTKLLPSLDLQNDSTNLNQSVDEQWQKCLKSKSIWNSLCQNVIRFFVT